MENSAEELRIAEERAESTAGVVQGLFYLVFGVTCIAAVVLGIFGDPQWFLLVPVSLVLASVPSAWVSERAERARRLREAAETWGAPWERDRDVAALRAFPHVEATVDDQSWADLEMDSAFAFLDRTCSAPGETILCSWLSRPDADAETLEARDRLANRLGESLPDRHRLREAISSMGYRGAAGAIDLLWRELPELPWFWPMLAPLSITPFFALAASLALGPQALVWGMVPLFFLNLILHLSVSHRLAQYREALVSLARLAAACQRVSGMPIEAIRAHQNRLREVLPAVRKVAESSNALLAELGDRGDILAAIYEYLGIMFLVTARAFVRALRTLEGDRRDLQRAFILLGELDAAYSIASLRAGLPTWCRPELDDGAGEPVVTGIRHPQIDDAVPNSLRLGERGALITGVNMSGKSTLLRTVGLGAIMAQSLATVPAERWAGPRLRILTSISHRDRILEGKSFFLVEAERMLELLRGATAEGRALVLVDELLRGTNSSERIGASVVLLDHIAKAGAIPLVATHELELAERLEGRFDAFHFEERVGDGALAFTYRLVPGIATTRNALRLLAELGLPDPLLDEATRIARECDERRS